MKIIIFTLLAFLPSTAFAEDAKYDARKLTLEDTIKYAATNNLDVAALRAEVDELRARSKRDRASFYPTLGVSGGLEAKFSGTDSENSPLGFVYGKYNIFNGYQDALQVKRDDVEIEKAIARLKKSEFKVGLEVEKHFHLFLYKKNLIDLKSAAISFNEKHKAVARRRVSAGLGSRADVMEFDVKESILKSELIELRQEQQEAKVGLKKLLGDDVGSRIEPSGSLQHQHLNGSLQSYLNKLSQNSESILLSSKNLDLAEIDLKKRRSDWLPKVDAEGKLGYLPEDERVSPESAGLSFKLMATWELFSGFDSVYARSEHNARVLRFQNELKSAILNAVTDLEKSYNRLKNIEKRVDLEEKNIDSLRKYHSTVLAEYNRGVKNSADLNAATDLVFDIVLRRENYKYDFLVEKLLMEEAIGERLEVETLPEPDASIKF